MNNQNSPHLPIGIILISAFYLFGALVLLAFLFINPAQASSQIAERHGLPAATGSWILLVVAGLGLFIAFGLISRSRWGYLLTILYLVYFGGVGLVLAGSNPATINFGNFLWALIVIVYLLIVRKRFFAPANP